MADMVAEAAPTGEPDLPDAAAYFAAVRSLDADQVATTAREWAAARTNEMLVDAFRDPVAAIPTGNARSIAGTIRVADFAVTRIVEATVHLLDLGAVTPHSGMPEPEALHRTVDVLTDLAPAADFVRAATGRPAPAVFPVLT
jgi:hypothetical protein